MSRWLLLYWVSRRWSRGGVEVAGRKLRITSGEMVQPLRSREEMMVRVTFRKDYPTTCEFMQESQFFLGFERDVPCLFAANRINAGEVSPKRIFGADVPSGADVVFREFAHQALQKTYLWGAQGLLHAADGINLRVILRDHAHASLCIRILLPSRLGRRVHTETINLRNTIHAGCA